MNREHGLVVAAVFFRHVPARRMLERLHRLLEVLERRTHGPPTDVAGPMPGRLRRRHCHRSRHDLIAPFHDEPPRSFGVAMAGQGCPSTRRHVRGRRSELICTVGRRARRPGHVRREATIGLEHPPIVVVRVPSARVRHDEDVASPQDARPGLRASAGRAARGRAQGSGRSTRPPGGACGESCARASPASHVIGRPQFVDSPRRSRNEVGQADPELGKP